jgi:hypothetical protein
MRNDWNLRITYLATKKERETMQFITMIVGFLLGFCIAGFMRAGKDDE